MSGHAALVLVVTPEGIPVVREPSKPPPIYWKLPGGAGLPGETPAETAARELTGETGAQVPPEMFRQVALVPRRNHTLYLMRADLPKLPYLVKVGNEGEEVAVMTVEEVIVCRNFLPSQQPLILAQLRLPVR